MENPKQTKGTAQRRNFKKVDAPEIVKWEAPGDALEGEYQGKRTVPRQDGTEAIIYDLKQDSGKRIAFWGAGFLNPIMKEVEPGSYIRVTFTEEVPPEREGDSPSRRFTVEVAE